MYTKTCIFCRKNKDSFNDEHVIPASIGGAFIINSVCKDCNEILGKKIDSPLAKHEVILFYRSQFKIARKDNRTSRNVNIPNPFRGKHKDADGNDVYIEFNSDGIPIPFLIPKFEEVSLDEENLVSITVTMSQKDFDEKKIIKLIAAKFNLDPNSITVLKKELIPQSTAQLKIYSDNNSFILGSLKIAYEFASSFLPDFLNDNYSLQFSNILLTANIDEYENKFYIKDEEIRNQLVVKVESIEGIKLHHHVLMLTSIPGIGLCCAVRLFNWTCTFNLSVNEKLLNQDIILVNDSIQQLFQISIPKKLVHFRVNIDLYGLSVQQIEILEEKSNQGYPGFKSIDGKLPIYNSNGELLFKNLDELFDVTHPLRSNCNIVNKFLVVLIHYKNGDYYIRNNHTNLFLPILKVQYIFNLLY